jgi:hypothetical protein
MDIKEFAPRHATYIDWLKEKETEIAIKLGVAIANQNQTHTGFCMGDYQRESCSDCPTEHECLDLGRKEKAQFYRRIDTLSLMKNIVSDAIDKEKI